jgi:hypothetical protein
LVGLSFFLVKRPGVERGNCEIFIKIKKVSDIYKKVCIIYNRKQMGVE